MEVWSGHAFMSPVMIRFSGCAAAQLVTSVACVSRSVESYGSRWVDISVMSRALKVMVAYATLRSLLFTSSYRSEVWIGNDDRIRLPFPLEDHCPYSCAKT